MSEVKYAITILKEKLANADRHNLAYQRLSVAEMEAIWGTLEKSDKDYAELKAQRDALAAENTVMKDYLKECSVVQGEGNWTSDAEKSVYVPAKDWMPLTPATDAYLNSVRAEAVTSFAHHQRVIADATPEHGCQRGRRFAAGLAEDFAAQLRAEEPL